MNFIAKIAAGTVGCMVLIVGGCTMVGVTTVATVNGLASSEAAEKGAKFGADEELREHNDRAGRDDPYHEYSDYNRDYYDNY